MENPLNKPKPRNGITTPTSAFRCFFKQQSISSTLSLPIRIAPAWSRMLRFGNTTKFKIEELFQVNQSFLMQFFLCLSIPADYSFITPNINKTQFKTNRKKIT